MFKEVKDIVIVGGGTSAWLSAAFLSRNIDYVNITLIDKEVGAPVGVGEGTLLNFDKFLKYCGFNTEDWFDEIDATFKSSIMFPNWGGQDSIIWHPFYLNQEYPEFDSSVYEAWTHHQDRDLHELLPYWSLSVKNNVDTQNLDFYAYHVDCSKLVQWLQKKLEDKITIIKSEVVEIKKNEDDYIESVTLKNGKTVHGDLFVDCTGFKQLLQTKPERVDLTGRLFCDTAVAGHVPYQNIESELNPYVISEAVDHGWIWNIPVQSRIGSGLVFNRNITDIETAKQYFCDYWDNRVTPDNLKVIDWTPYYNKNMWDKNVVAVGLSGGFIEPLESTGVATITLAIYELANRIRPGYFDTIDAEVFNALMSAVYEDAIDFINMHYAQTYFDTSFWNFVKETRIDSPTYLRFKKILESGERFNNHGKGHIFGAANWWCWLLQQEENISPQKNITSETADLILKDWKKQMDLSVEKPETVSHISAIKNYMLYLNTNIHRKELRWGDDD